MQKCDFDKERDDIVIKWLIFSVFFVLVLGLSLFLFCALKISSRCSREEERRDAYKYIGNHNKK